jgi:hypothetical protein
MIDLPGLRSLSLFGSCLAEATRAPGSIPDLFAVVDDARAAARALGAGRAAAAALVRPLPPATLALLGAGGAPLAKVNLIEPAALRRALREGRLPDLTVVGRLSKRVEVVWARDSAAAAEIAAALEAAARAVARAALLDLPRRLPLAAFARRCFALSYRGEVRPESAAQIGARFDAFAPLYEQRFGRLAAALAPPGITVAGGELYDGRSPGARLRDRLALAALLGRSRLRSVLRWPRAALLYRGSLRYVLGKLRRARGWYAPRAEWERASLPQSE